MDLYTLNYKKTLGWSSEALPRCDSRQTLVIIFGASEFFDASEPIREIKESYPLSHIIGCSTAGEIFGTEINDHSLSVAVLKFHHTSVQTSYAEIHSAGDSHRAGETIAKDLFRPGLKGILILSVGTNVNGSELVRGLNSILPSTIAVSGGLAGDGERFNRTWIISDGKPHDPVARKQGGQVFLLLLLGAKKQQFLGTERDGAQLLPDPWVNFPEFLKNQGVLKVSQTGAAVFLGNEQPNQIELTGLLDDFSWKGFI